ncbi:MAG: tyrosine-type recombinase/integrase [Terriglobales bacterium]
MIDSLPVRMSGPLEPFAAGFAAWLSGQGYPPSSAAQQLQLMAHLSRWLAAEGCDAGAVDDEVVDAFVASRRACGYTSRLTGRALVGLLGYLRGLGAMPAPLVRAPEGPVEGLLDRYRRYLVVERGVSASTVRGNVRAVRPFLDGRVSSDGLGLDLEHLCAGDVMAFVVARCPSQSQGSAKLTVRALRSLLGFLYVEGVIDRPLAGAVPSVASWRLSGLPKGLGPAQVANLLESCDQGTVVGRRDLAILMLLARLGLRAGEVAALELEDVDWRAGELLVRGKGSRCERLPLPADVGERIAAYLRDGRPGTAQGRAVFVRVKAPHRELTSGAVSQVVAVAAQRAGLGAIYAHRLRHTAASELLRAGSSLVEVGQILRHRSMLTTAIYAKVDLEALRSIARSWPGGEA